MAKEDEIGRIQERLYALEAEVAALRAENIRIKQWIKAMFPRPRMGGTRQEMELKNCLVAYNALFGEEE